MLPNEQTPYFFWQALHLVGTGSLSRMGLLPSGAVTLVHIKNYIIINTIHNYYDD